MKKISIFTAILALIVSVGFVAPVSVFAQYYTTYSNPATYVTPTYSTVYSTPIYGTACTNLTGDLSIGVRDTVIGGQVTALQNFLISQNYLMSGRSTGYYGSLTYQAVARYQVAHGLFSSGAVDAATRASINTVSCGNNYGYNYGYNNGYNGYYAAPVISYLSTNSAAVGASVTIYGSGFDLYNNSVNFNGTALAGIPSYQGTALAFTVPQINAVYNSNYNYGYNTTGTYSVSVTTNHGTSNAVSLTVTGNNYNYNNNCYYPYNYNGYGYNSNCYNNYNNSPISISNVSGPTNLTQGTQGTWSMNLYNPNSNYVSVSAKWGDENNYNAYGYSYTQSATQSSYTQGQQTISFTHTYQAVGSYTVVFTATDNQGAQTTASATVYVSGNVYINGNQPILSSISPNSGRIGTQVVLYGSWFTPTGNVVHFGNGGMNNLSASNGGNSIYYTIPSYLTPCDITSGLMVACPAYAQQVTPGTYPVYVSNTYGQTSTLYFTVTY